MARPTGDTPTRTRRRILDALKLNGPSDAATLAADHGTTTMAIRQHLYALQDEGFVSFSEMPRAVGRPAKVWSLTDAAQKFFPDGHADLTTGLIGAMRAVFGEDGVQRLIQERTAEQTALYARRLDPLNSLKDKLEELAAIRNEEGYMAAVEREGDDFLFVENHCPICAAASVCSGLCAGELTVYKAVLGPGVAVERTDHILAGARRCAYRVSAVR